VASSAEASARTVAAAVEAAAAQMGLRPDQVEVEVLKQPVPSTFGKVGEPAVVRVVERTGGTGVTAEAAEMAAVASQPSVVEAGASRQERAPRVTNRPKARESGGGRRHPEVTDPEAIAADTELAGDFVEGLLDALDVDGDITTWVDAAGGHVDIEGLRLDFLVGTEGETLNALQELTRRLRAQDRPRRHRRPRRRPKRQHRRGTQPPGRRPPRMTERIRSAAKTDL
jgi:predicted RNA-binding protein Jag